MTRLSSLVHHSRPRCSFGYRFTSGFNAASASFSPKHLYQIIGIELFGRSTCSKVRKRITIRSRTQLSGDRNQINCWVATCSTTTGGDYQQRKGDEKGSPYGCYAPIHLDDWHELHLKVLIGGEYQLLAPEKPLPASYFFDRARITGA